MSTLSFYTVPENSEGVEFGSNDFFRIFGMCMWRKWGIFI